MLHPGLSKKIITISSKPREHVKTRYATFKREKTDDDGVRTTYYHNVPKIEEDHTQVELFHIFRDFDELRIAHQIDDGELLFCYFRSIVSTCRKAAKLWSAEADTVRSRSEATFDIAYEAFKATILSRLNYYEQLEYIRTLRKPRPMSVEEFCQELEILNDYAMQFPDAPDDAEGLTDDEMKRLFYRAMPTSWQRAYTQAGKRYANYTLEEILDFMEIQEELDPYQPRKNENKSDTVDDDSDDASNNASVNEHADNDIPEESDAANDDY